MTAEPACRPRYVIYSVSLGVFLAIHQGALYFSRMESGPFWLAPTFPSRENITTLIEGWQKVINVSDFHAIEVDTELDFVTAFNLVRAGIPQDAVTQMAMNLPVAGRA